MSRDYAPSSRREFPVVWVLSGVAVGAGLALLASVFLTPLPENEERLVQERPASPAPAAQAAPSLPPKETARFKFYELLPNFEIIPFGDPTAQPTPVPTRAASGSTQKPAPAPAGNEIYFVQAGSFRKQEDAEAQRARLALLGFTARIEAVSIPGRGRFFRLRIGPHESIDHAKGVIRRLADNGVESYFYRERKG